MPKQTEKTAYKSFVFSEETEHVDRRIGSIRPSWPTTANGGGFQPGRHQVARSRQVTAEAGRTNCAPLSTAKLAHALLLFPFFLFSRLEGITLDQSFKLGLKIPEYFIDFDREIIHSRQDTFELRRWLVNCRMLNLPK